MTPSATSCEMAKPFGPIGARPSGTSIGRDGAQPGECIIWQGAPSICTTSPCNSARTWRTYVARSAHRTPRWPIESRAVKPVPKYAHNLPGERSSIVAMADAVTIGWRRLDTATPVASPIPGTPSAIRASAIQTSP